MTPGRWLRTLRHLRPVQVWAQLRHRIAAPLRPARVATDGLELPLERAACPFLMAPRHARWDGWRRVELLGRAVVFGDAFDWDHADQGPLWSYHLHQFDYVRRPALAPSARVALLLDWIERHPSGVGWRPHPISLRIMAWGKLLLSPGALQIGAAERARVLRSLACQVETLARHPERRLQANHLFSNRLAVVFGGLLLRGAAADRWLAQAPLLQRELAAQILPDGHHEERSPMYHSLLLENVLDLLNLARAAHPRAPDALVGALEETAGRMLAALECVTHPDGEIALFADSAFGIAHAPSALRAYASRLGVESRALASAGVLPDAGFVRIASDPFTLIASVAGPLPAHQPGHAHCDALGFELSVGAERVVTDTGVSEYIPGALRDASRRTAAHATLQVDGAEQAEIWGAHRIGGRPRVALDAVEPLRTAEARCASWSTPDTVHHRRFEVDGRTLRLHDRLEGRSRRVRLALPIAPGLRPVLDGGRAMHLQLASGRRLRIALPDAPGLRWRLETTPYFPEFGSHEQRACLVGEAASFESGVWRFEVD